jgi:hypothetical protein
LLIIEQLAQDDFLIRAALEEKQGALYGRRVGHGTAIKFGAGEGVDVAFEADELGFVDRLSDTCGDGGRLGEGRGAIGLGWRLRRGAKSGPGENDGKKEKAIAKYI